MHDMIMIVRTHVPSVSW